MAHQPQRTCVACRAVKAPDEMIRAASQNGQAPRLGDKEMGRGAYLCPKAECAKIAWKRRAFERALKLKVPLDAAFKDRVEAAILAAQTSQINSQESQHMN